MFYINRYVQTGVLLLLLDLLLLRIGGGAMASDAGLLTETRPEMNFFMDKFFDCRECRTITAIVSQDEKHPPFAEAFKRISEKFGTRHAGAIMSKYEAWENFQIFDSLGCNALDQYGNRFVIYADRKEKYCLIFPYKHEGHMMGMITLIAKNLDDYKAIEINSWRQKTVRVVDEYVAQYPIVQPLRDPAIEFIGYLEKKIRSGARN